MEGLNLKIGLLGGTFDPVHHGHLLIAQDACEQAGLDRVLFVPAAASPLRESPPRASAADRLAMLRLAVDGDERFAVSEVELERGGVSYTIDSARQFRGLFPQAGLYWIIGADQVAQLPKWREIEELCGLLEFIALERPGHPLSSLPALPSLRLHRARSHPFEVSSTELRERAAQGLSLRYFLPAPVVSYVESRNLYQKAV